MEGCNFNQIDTVFLKDEILSKMLDSYKKATQRLILLDYDGTLVPFTAQYDAAFPQYSQLNILTALMNDKNNHICIISGRSKHNLEKWFGHFNLNLAAEHGFWIKDDGNWKLSKSVNMDWMDDYYPIMQLFVKCLPGTVIEKKEYSLVWHFRNTNPLQANPLAQELYHRLKSRHNPNVKVLFGDKIIEAKSSAVGKDFAAKYFLNKNAYDFIIAFGDDVTDEDIFKVLDETSYSVKVGSNQTKAKFRITSQTEVIPMLKLLHQASLS